MRQAELLLLALVHAPHVTPFISPVLIYEVLGVPGDLRVRDLWVPRAFGGFLLRDNRRTGRPVAWTFERFPHEETEHEQGEEDQRSPEKRVNVESVRIDTARVARRCIRLHCRPPAT